MLLFVFHLFASSFYKFGTRYNTFTYLLQVIEEEHENATDTSFVGPNDDAIKKKKLKVDSVGKVYTHFLIVLHCIVIFSLLNHSLHSNIFIVKPFSALFYVLEALVFGLIDWISGRICHIVIFFHMINPILLCCCFTLHTFIKVFLQKKNSYICTVDSRYSHTICF